MVRYFFDDAGGFLAGDDVVASYAYPTSQHAIAARGRPDSVAKQMVLSDRLGGCRELVQGYSAMGTWALFVGEDRDSRNPSCFRAFERVQGLYGWQAIPAPVAFRCRDGRTVERLTDW